MRILVSGSSGLIGTALLAAWREQNRETTRLVRGGANSGTDVPWDPATGNLDPAALEGFDAVVHLAGENIAGGRWTPARKAAIRDSRVQSTRLMAEALARCAAGPRTLVCASAIGFYGDTGDTAVDETAPPGNGFLAEVCQAWETATAPASEAGIRVVNLRTGIVLSTRGGALQRMLLPFRLGLGGVVGTGRQYMSWITLDDIVRAIIFCIEEQALSGPVNGTAPEPVTNRAFTKTLGHALHRPTLLPMPATAVRLLFGEMGDALLLSGARIMPKELMEHGFAHAHPDLTGALRHVLAL